MTRSASWAAARRAPAIRSRQSGSVSIRVSAIQGRSSAARSWASFTFQIAPSCNGAPGARSSAPVHSTATRSRRRTGSAACPAAASVPTSRAPMMRPAARISVDCAASSPARRILAPRSGRREGRPGQDPQRSAGRRRRRVRRSRRGTPGHPQPPRPRPREVRAPQREAIHCGAVEGRHRGARMERLREDPAAGGGAIEPLGLSDRRAEREPPRPRRLDADRPPAPSAQSQSTGRERSHRVIMRLLVPGGLRPGSSRSSR